MDITTTTQNAIAERLDAITADFCQIHLDCHGRARSVEERSELDRLEAEMHSLYQQLKDMEQQRAAAMTPAPAIPAPEMAAASSTSASSLSAYNGYPNGETYSVIRCLDSNATHVEAARAIVAAAWWNASDEVLADRGAVVTPRADAADALRAWLEEEENPLAETATVYTDLLAHALAHVDWGEVADHYAPNPLPSVEPILDPDEGEQEQPEQPEAEWRHWLSDCGD